MRRTDEMHREGKETTQYGRLRRFALSPLPQWYREAAKGLVSNVENVTLPSSKSPQAPERSSYTIASSDTKSIHPHECLDCSSILLAGRVHFAFYNTFGSSSVPDIALFHADEFRRSLSTDSVLVTNDYEGWVLPIVSIEIF